MKLNHKFKSMIAAVGLVSIAFVSSCNAQKGASKNGFDLSNASIPIDKILSGVPGKTVFLPLIILSLLLKTRLILLKILTEY